MRAEAIRYCSPLRESSSTYSMKNFIVRGELEAGEIAALRQDERLFLGWRLTPRCAFPFWADR